MTNMNDVPPHELQPAPNGENQPNGLPSTVRSDIISDQADLPYARYISFGSLGIPEHYASFAALFANGDHSAILLFAETHSESHAAFDLRDRLRQTEYQTVKEGLATAEIIQVVHELHVQEEVEDQTEVEKAAFDLIADAHAMGASDIHIETRQTYAQVYFRIDGTRIKIRQYSMKTAKAICSVLFNTKADEDSKTSDWSPDEILDTVISYTPENGESVQLRFNSAPIYPSGNFQNVMRVAGQGSTRTLEDLNYLPAQIEAVEEMIVGSQGMVILVGPTNSGKTTTMHALISRIMDLRGPGTKVTTIERPVESILPVATQVSVTDTDGDASCEKALLATFRQDPDVVMFGEVQEHKAANMVKNLVLAGRKLLTTLHVFEAPAVFSRLRELGVPDSVLFMPRFISGIVYTRLLPKLCAHCQEDLSVDNSTNQLWPNTYKRLKAMVPDALERVKVKGKGCQHCFNTGVKGRVPCLEILTPDRKYLDLLRQGNESAARDHWLSSNGQLDIDGRGHTAMAHAVHRMLAGEVSPTDIEIYLGPLVLEVPENPSRA